MNIVFGIIIGLIILMLLVIAHEFGHFIMACRSDVKVNEFGIGFPPRTIAWVRNPEWKKGKKGVKKWLRLPKEDWGNSQETLIFSINWLPIGGFCAMDGESDADTRPGTFGSTSFWGKTKILFGGVLMNWLVAFVLLTILAFTGMPQFLENQFQIESDSKIIGNAVIIKEVTSGSPAEAAGFMADDAIIGIDGEPISNPNEVTAYGQAHPGETVVYNVIRNNEQLELSAKLNEADAEYSLGVQMQYGQTFVRSTWSAPIVGLGTTLQITGETFRSLGELVWNLVSGVFRQFSFNDEVRESGQAAIASAGDAVSGPVGIIGVLFPAFAESGVANLTFLAALISISLACMNVLPIPALDGGRWLLIAIFRLRRKKLTKETEEKVVSRAFAVLFVLIIVITILDITRFF